jgi:serine/threonine protein kinase/Tfp pilus assembly protein PilF/WD40 repeat protein
MSTQSSGREPVEALAEEFAERLRRGERPSVTEYTEKYPELAAQIRDLFPALVVMEQFGSVAGPPTGPFHPQAESRGAIPSQLGEYRLLREVGRGGMGVVYEAVQESLGRHVALKVLPLHHLMSPTHLERFRREARAAAQLHHTNIVPVFGVGECEGIHYYAMQFIQGQGLDTVLEEVRRLRVRKSGPAGEGKQPTRALSASIAQGLLTGRFEVGDIVGGPDANPDGERSGHDRHRDPRPGIEPGAATGTRTELQPEMPDGRSELAGQTETQYCRSVAQVGVQVAEALAYAHRQRILHRDIKPSNLLLDTRGTVWITDFGLAKAEGSDDLTSTGDLVGTMRFMAPERFQGKADPRSDIYSLGLTLYEMLTLRPAFADSDRARLMERVTHEDPPRPRKLDPHLPRDLETIVLKALAKDPADRYASAEALAEDLRRFLADRPIWARRASLAERTWRWCRRNPAVACLLVVVALLLVAGSVLSTVAAVQFDLSRQRAEDAEREARLRQRAEDAEREARLQARLREAEALLFAARGTRYSRQPGQRFEALEALKKATAIGRELGQPPGWFDRLRNEAIAALALPDIHITQTVPNVFEPEIYRAEVSQDFELYARTTKQGACSVRRVADDVEVFPLPELGKPATPSFGPGRLLVLYGETSKRFQLWDLGEREPVLRVDKCPILCWGFRPDGRLLILRHGDKNGDYFGVYATDTGACKRRLLPDGVAGDLNLSPHPTEPVIAISSWGRSLFQVRDLKTGALRTAPKLPWRRPSNCVWSPDGSTLALADAGGGGMIHLYTFDRESGELQPKPRVIDTRLENGGASLAFSPAGDRLVLRGWVDEVHLFDVQTGRRLFSTHPLRSSGYQRLCFNLSGNRLAGARVGPRKEQLGLWSVADAREYRALVHDGAGESEPITRLPAVHPDGRLAAQFFTNGLALFDLETGRELKFMEDPRGRSPCFDGTGNLLTNAFSGFFRWPVRHDPARPGRLTVGPAKRLPFKPGHRSIAASRDGKVIAQAMFNGYGMGPYAGGWILHPNAPQPRWVEKGRSMVWASVSPDGLWVAFGLLADRVNVYEAATGRRVWQSPADGDDYCRFSSDGRWLLTDNDGSRAYAVGTWKPGPRLGPGRPWDVTSDGLAVLGLTDGIYRLVERATGREVARLEGPNRISGAAVFTPDGTRLVVGAKDGLRVWDLRRIRAELAKLDLDWDWPPYPPLNKKDQVAPLEITVDLGELAPKLPKQSVTDKLRQEVEKLNRDLAKNPKDAEAYFQRGLRYYRLKEFPKARDDFDRAIALKPDHFDAYHHRGHTHERLGQAQKAIDDFSTALKGQPKDAHLHHVRGLNYLQLKEYAKAVQDLNRALELKLGRKDEEANACYHLARIYVAGPAEFRAPDKALPRAKKAVELAPDKWAYCHTLGVVQYRQGQYKEAVTTLEKSLAVGKGQGDAFDLFFLAMCHHHLGNAGKARYCFHRAVKWRQGQKNLSARQAEELKAFQDEAAALLSPAGP